MRARTGLLILTAVNLAAVGVSLALQVRAARPAAELGVLRGHALEIIDDQGRVRASIGVLPAGGGEGASDTVLLRLITALGRPSVKIGASEPSSGLSFAGPTGTTNAWLVLKTEGPHSSLRLRDEDGREQIVGP